MNKDDVARLVDRLGSTLAGLETPMMQGDNLAITLCSAFDNPEQEVDEDTGWSPDAEAGYKEVCGAIHAHYAPTIEALADALTTLSARVEALETHNSDAYIVVIDLAASLAAAISLLEKGGKAAKKAAPSDKMFDQMLRDYQKSLDRARQALAGDDHGHR